MLIYLFIVYFYYVMFSRTRRTHSYLFICLICLLFLKLFAVDRRLGTMHLFQITTTTNSYFLLDIVLPHSRQSSLSYIVIKVNNNSNELYTFCYTILSWLLLYMLKGQIFYLFSKLNILYYMCACKGTQSLPIDDNERP